MGLCQRGGHASATTIATAIASATATIPPALAGPAADLAVPACRASGPAALLWRRRGRAGDIRVEPGECQHGRGGRLRPALGDPAARAVPGRRARTARLRPGGPDGEPRVLARRPVTDLGCQRRLPRPDAAGRPR